jgi:hypothetical protein
MQRQAVRSRHEDAREALVWMGPYGERCTPYCFGPTVDSDQSVGANPSTRCKLASRDGNATGAGLCMSFFGGPLASTLDDVSIGFSTRRDDPSNREFSLIDNDR